MIGDDTRTIGYRNIIGDSNNKSENNHLLVKEYELNLLMIAVVEKVPKSSFLLTADGVIDD